MARRATVYIHVVNFAVGRYVGAARAIRRKISWAASSAAEGSPVIRQANRTTAR